MRLFFEWVKSKRKTFLYVLIIYAAFFSVYALYGYEWSVAGYAALLALAMGVVFVLVSFFQFLKKHELLENQLKRLPMDNLPEPGNLIEKDYTALVDFLEYERTRAEAEKEKQKRDAEEYYTLWVHQVKTPIAAMRLMLQSEDMAKADLQQELYKIEQYVSMVLQYQRLSSFEGDLELKRYEIDALVKTALKGCAPLFIHKKIPVEFGELDGSVVTDQKWMVFVLEQVLTNAVKYTAKGRVLIFTNGNRLIIEDTGIGIAADDLPRIFERGFTGAIGRRERSSTGIGLYLSREILRRLGFSLSIESKQGEGTRVMFDLGQSYPEID